MADMETFTRTIDGKKVTRTAHSPAEAIRLQYTGWERQGGDRKSTSPASSSAATK